MNKLFKYQGIHLLAYIIIGLSIYYITLKNPSGQGEFWKLSTFDWIIFSWIFVAMHQGWVLLFWRLELYFGKISSWMGKSGFVIFRIGFIIFASLRLLSLLPISISSSNTLFLPFYIRILLIILTTPLILWVIYSIIRYFSITRLFGADHFDPMYREKSLEIRGIFKYIPNSMYTILLLIIYHPALLFDSFHGLYVVV